MNMNMVERRTLNDVRSSNGKGNKGGFKTARSQDDGNTMWGVATALFAIGKRLLAHLAG
jgi:hypothetical protein